MKIESEKLQNLLMRVLTFMAEQTEQLKLLFSHLSTKLYFGCGTMRRGKVNASRGRRMRPKNILKSKHY